MVVEEADHGQRGEAHDLRAAAAPQRRRHGYQVVLREGRAVVVALQVLSDCHRLHVHQCANAIVNNNCFSKQIVQCDAAQRCRQVTWHMLR